MIRPLTAMIVFLPIVESQTVCAIDGRRSVRVASAMDTTLRPPATSGPRHDQARVHRHCLLWGLGWGHAVPAAPVLRGRGGRPALHPGRGRGTFLTALAVAADPGA